MPIQLVRREGKKATLCLVVENGKNRFEEFMKQLRRKRRDLAPRLTATLKWILANGVPSNNDYKFKYEEKGIYAIREGQARIYCFFGPKGELCLTHGIVKKDQRAKRADLNLALRLKRATEQSEKRTK